MAEKIGIRTIPYYMIISKCSGMALDVMEESARMFYTLDTPLQHWSFEDRGNGCVSIINRGTHQVLDVDMAGVDNGTAVHMWQDINAANQLWILEPAGKDTYRIKAKHSKRYLDICGQSLASGAHLNIWEGTSSDTQLWIIREVAEEPRPESSAEQVAQEPKRRRTRKAAAETEVEIPVKKTRKPRIPRKPRAKKEAAAPEAMSPPVAETPQGEPEKEPEEA